MRLRDVASQNPLVSKYYVFKLFKKLSILSIVYRPLFIIQIHRLSFSICLINFVIYTSNFKLCLQVRFLTSVYHLNVSQTTGHVCLAFLNDNNWLPTRTIEDVLSAVFSILIRPEPENAYDPATLNMYNGDNTKYQQMARKSAQNAK